MLVPLEWLREYCDPALGTEELARRLTLTGTKAERTFRHGVPSGEHYVVGRVVETAAHPAADRLAVCRVDLGAETATIVCGAPNVAAGQTVAVARPGARLPDGRTLAAAKLRGVVSEGMILASDELALGGDHSGILVLEPGTAPGTPLGEVLPLGTDVIELEVTPNRPDCLSVYGVAREASAATATPLRPPPWSEDPGTLDGEPTGIAVTVEEPELCPRFTVRVFEEVTVGPSPLWLAARLLAAGMRPISTVVDITNYVMLLTGQPLHAFDLDAIAGGRLTVRRARDGETIETLDGVQRTLDPDLLVICDDDGPTSIAAIMGGARSEVTETTTRVALEAASWNGAHVQRSALRLGLRSEASGRFEKGLSAGSTLEAQAVATALLIELCGARVLPGTLDVGGAGEEAPPLALRPARAAALLGSPVAPERCRQILRALEFAVDAGGEEEIVVGVPHFRARDVTREVDLIEEVARIDGLDRLPATLPPRRGAAGRLTPAQSLRRRAQDALAGRGLAEIVGWSFADPRLLTRLRVGADESMSQVVEIENPLSETWSIMRPTLLGSLLDAAARNVARGVRDLGLFESGTVYRAAASGPLADEHHALAVLIAGQLAAGWRGEGAPADLYAAKALLGAVLDVLGLAWSVSAQPRSFLHPGRSAAVMAGSTPLGFLGELHPLVAAEWGLDGAAVWAIDLDAAVALAPGVARYQPFAEYPPVREDLAVVVGSEVSAAEVIEVVRAAGGKRLARVEVFDVYRGTQVGEGRVSLALHLEFRAADRTLADEEVAVVRAKIADALAERVGGELRG
jgi:phenylalanyl-tRNA synthetase beta chain